MGASLGNIPLSAWKPSISPTARIMKTSPPPSCGPGKVSTVSLVILSLRLRFFLRFSRMVGSALLLPSNVWDALHHPAFYYTCTHQENENHQAISRPLFLTAKDVIDGLSLPCSIRRRLNICTSADISLSVSRYLARLLKKAGQNVMPDFMFFHSLSPVFVFLKSKSGYYSRIASLLDIFPKFES